MNVQEVEARMVEQITGLEEQETRLQEWLECLRKVEGIAAQWDVELIETVSEEPRERSAEVSQVSEPAPIQEPVEIREKLSGPETAEDPFDRLRRKLTGKAKSKPVFNSGPLFGARA